MNVTTTPNKTRCSRCGALLEMEFGAPQRICEYCGSTVETGLAGGGGKPDQIALCTLTESAARRCAADWLRREHEDILPDLAARAKITNLDGAYWPFYLVRGVYSGWCPTRGSISGGFSELLLAGGPLLHRSMSAPAYRFFTPPSDQVSLEDLSKRMMAELLDEMRSVAHVDFCQSVLRFRGSGPLVQFRGSDLDSLTLVPFAEPFDAAERRLKEMLGSRARVRDLYFPQVSVSRIYWPFWVADYVYAGHTYFVIMDGTSSDGAYCGGYKPLLPERARLDLSKLAGSDVDDIVHLFSLGGGDSGERGSPLLRIETNNGEVRGSCFIATAAYGSELAGDVEALRRWRDHALTPTACGRQLIALYYRLSPPLAAVVARSHWLRSAVRVLLRPLVRHSRRTAH